MPAFEILEFSEARLASFTKREETHGDEKVPAFSIGLRMDAPNTMLDLIDPSIRQSLYMAVPGQDELPGVDPATPVLRCNSFERIALTAAHEGWTLEVDDGIDETTPMTFGGCKVDRFLVDAKQGGSVELSFRVGSSDIDADRLGRLGIRHGHSIWIKLRKPLIGEKQKPIDGTGEEFQKDHPDAGDLFAAEHGDGTDDLGTDDLGTDDLGTDDQQIDGGDADAEFEAGARAAIEKAGVKPKRGKKVTP